MGAICGWQRCLKRDALVLDDHTTVAAARGSCFSLLLPLFFSVLYSGFWACTLTLTLTLTPSLPLHSLCTLLLPPPHLPHPTHTRHPHHTPLTSPQHHVVHPCPQPGCPARVHQGLSSHGAHLPGGPHTGPGHRHRPGTGTVRRHCRGAVKHTATATTMTTFAFMSYS